MNLEEHYLVAVTYANGRIETFKYDDVSDAMDDYTFHSINLGRGESAKLIRYSTVTMVSKTRA
ncbi:hypothetical protein [Streptomyces sp. 6N106]|uniref:hypothetical protein n=1 Tax=Streptomyces sp. 6N106 TaxID=3457418 RepID=UPI003FD2C9E4